MSDEADDFDLEEDPITDDVAGGPNDAANSGLVVAAKIPKDILEKYEVYSYRNAAIILSEARQDEFNELLSALRNFSITTQMIRTAGGNKSDIPKLFSETLRPLGWHETTIQGDLVVKRMWRISGKANSAQSTREKFIDGHKIDYVKGKVAFDLEWNSKDQTFDRDLYAFNAFSQCGVIDVGVLVTRSASLNAVFRKLGPSLKKDGTIDYQKSGAPRTISAKYGASTTWMGKLLYRLNAGRNGSCPVLVLGITPKCIFDWKDED